MNAGFRNRAIATCRFCTDPTVQLPHTYIIREEEEITIIIISLFWETLNDTIAQSIDVVMYNITKFANEHSKLQTVQTSVQQQLREISYNRSAHSIILTDGRTDGPTNAILVVALPEFCISDSSLHCFLPPCLHNNSMGSGLVVVVVILVIVACSCGGGSGGSTVVVVVVIDTTVGARCACLHLLGVI